MTGVGSRIRAVGRSAHTSLLMTLLMAHAGKRMPDHTRRLAARELGRLRGLPVKLGQMLAEEPDLLPEPVRHSLRIHHDDVVPMSAAQVRKAFLDTFGEPPQTLFERFESKPFAAASLGQVHSAWMDGARLAVKVQYPGLADRISSDLSMLRGMMKSVPWARQHLGVLDELERSLHGELDYNREAVALRQLGSVCRESGVRTPDAVFPKTRHNILTMTYVEAQRLDEMPAIGPDGMAAARSAVLRCWRAQVVSGQIHADPSPGNLLIGVDHVPTLVDFGCTRSLSTDVRDLLLDLIDGRGGDRSRYEALGFFDGLDGPSADALAAALLQLERWLHAPFAAGPGQTGTAHVQEGRQLLKRLVAMPQARVHPEFILTFRSFYALFKWCDNLEAKGNHGT